MSAAEKVQLRARALAARLQSGGDQDGITRNLAGVLRPHAGKILSGYWPMRGEADPLPAMAAHSGPLCLPVVTGKAVPLIFRAWDGKALEPGPFGTSHPPASAPELSPRVLIVPLAAFDRTGNRIGYGGGYYDRTLEVLRRDGACVAIGLAFASQELQSIPVEAFDQRLDMIVTDHDVILPAGG
ncbi:5-formyltetrahydrofolate cyclo-ligase [Paracoccus sp. R12_1]|uniref:5-formyltetrahydrofolate cyclo-ligase n=1 Tax=unclassified Paracoccus (in: a-proteobacteria) TaxID=2688777 RepID=UPI001ADB2C5B|nr:5-formyltetrahydrofolate cyclo-ligase [Paracoccus sp. R12_2]MBO9484918.1 5-formyltetrahydrofolate cyclo-ligase [Paracoccus sp. R12_1]